MVERIPAEDRPQTKPKKPATAWVDFLCGLLFGLIAAAVIWHRCKRNDIAWGWVFAGLGTAIAFFCVIPELA